MSNVEFSEEKIYNQNIKNNPMKRNSTSLINWLIKYKLAKSTKQANIILLIVSAILLGLTLNICFQAFRSNNKKVSYQVSQKALQNLPSDIRQEIINQNAK